MKAMNYAWVEDLDVVDSLIHDDMWVMEQKMDGTRGIVVLRGGEQPQMLHRNGGPLKHTAATQHLDRIWDVLEPVMYKLRPGSWVVLDGEIMIGNGEYRVFDMPRLNIGGIEIMPSSLFQVRREALEAMLPAGGTVSVVPQARGTHNKQQLFHDANHHGVEGVMFKHRLAPYLPGERTDRMLKYKFVKTADVVVIDSSRGRNAAGRETGSFTLAVSGAGGEMIPVGACSAIGKPHTEVGDVIEVAYLYWTGSTLYQPRMVKVRDDKQPYDCRLDQFRPYSREQVTR